MKALRDISDKIKPHFEAEGPFKKWYPLYEAFDSFLFGSRDTTESAPHVRDSVDLKRVMVIVIVALIPCALMAMWNTGYQANLAMHHLGMSEGTGWRGGIMSFIGYDPTSLFSNFSHGALYFLPVYMVTLLVGSAWEAVFNLIRGHEFSEAFLVTSLLFALILPPTIPLWQVALGISFGVIFAKEVFGGVGRNFMNPALAARAFIYFAYPAQMSGDAIWTAVDGISSATALTQLATAAPGSGMNAVSVTWMQSFLGTVPGSMGETSTLACLFGAAVLLATGIASWRIMVSMLLGGLLCSVLFMSIGSATNPMAALPPYWHLVLGGFAFGLVFMATDPVSAAHTHGGQWLFGLLIGALTILIRVANPAYPEGVMLAILLGNVFAPLFDYCVIQANIKRRKLRHG
jgi:Na+-transporting NADH:ubiquinone oxidoreductase subunit B